jgi:carbamoyl-phosphate synthase large subunit
MVDYFRSALDGRGLVLAANSYPETAGMFAADRSFVVPTLDDPSYIDSISEICAGNEVRLLVSLYDLDVVVLSRARERLLQIGTVAAVPNPNVADTCFDKWLSYLFAERCDLTTPKTYLRLEEAREAIAQGEAAFPVLLKPRWGAGSQGISSVEDLEQLNRAYGSLCRATECHPAFRSVAARPELSVIIQEKISGIEYGLDVFNGLDSRYVASFAKEKLEMRAGETDRARTVENAMLREIAVQLAAGLKHVGNLDVDIIVKDDIPFFIEMNARLGGHYPFAHAAGANLPAALVQMVLGGNLDSSWLGMTPGVVSAKGIQVLSRGSAIAQEREPGTAR